MRHLFNLSMLIPLGASLSTPSANSSYINPIIPGWHSDPECLFVPEEDNTFFCTTSSFLSFPGIPIFASKDLLQWKLVSNAFSRPEQVPSLANTTLQLQSDGVWASTLRYREGTFYLATALVGIQPTFHASGLLFQTKNIYDDSAWNDPLTFHTGDIDCDLFWDDDGTLYITYAGVSQETLDLKTGIASPGYRIWNGTGGATPEGPHIIKRDGYYYLLISEGGTALGHKVTIARSKNVSGPYEGYAGNPILTNTNTSQYFQTVGHSDIFQDQTGNWWGICLATRSGPEFVNYPMGRESVLFPVTWKTGEWPIFEPVRGRMSGWPLPKPSRNIPGSGSFVQDPDILDFAPSSSIPSHFIYWRFPPPNAFTVSPPEKPFSLRVNPSISNLTGSPSLNFENASISFVSRRQTHTCFTYTVDMTFNPRGKNVEAGVTLFLTQFQHIDLSIISLPSLKSGKVEPYLRFKATTIGIENVTIPTTVTQALPQTWIDKSIRFKIQAVNDTHYAFSATNPATSQTLLTSFAEGTILSGGSGPFTGTILGVYATTNGGSGGEPAYFKRWRYDGQCQKIDFNDIIRT